MGIFDIKHWIVILIVVLLVFGTKRLKTLGADLGETIKGFRKAMHSAEEPNTTAGASTQEPNQPGRTIDSVAAKVDDTLHTKS